VRSASRVALSTAPAIGERAASGRAAAEAAEVVSKTLDLVATLLKRSSFGHGLVETFAPSTTAVRESPCCKRQAQIVRVDARTPRGLLRGESCCPSRACWRPRRRACARSDVSCSARRPERIETRRDRGIARGVRACASFNCVCSDPLVLRRRRGAAAKRSATEAPASLDADRVPAAHEGRAVAQCWAISRDLYRPKPGSFREDRASMQHGLRAIPGASVRDPLLAAEIGDVPAPPRAPAQRMYQAVR